MHTRIMISPKENRNKNLKQSKRVKKPEAKVKKGKNLKQKLKRDKETRTSSKKETKKPELKVKRNNVAEVILPDLN